MVQALDSHTKVEAVAQASKEQAKTEAQWTPLEETGAEPVAEETPNEEVTVEAAAKAPQDEAKAESLAEEAA